MTACSCPDAFDALSDIDGYRVEVAEYVYAELGPLISSSVLDGIAGSLTLACRDYCGLEAGFGCLQVWFCLRLWALGQLWMA